MEATKATGAPPPPNGGGQVADPEVQAFQMAQAILTRFPELRSRTRPGQNPAVPIRAALLLSNVISIAETEDVPEQLIAPFRTIDFGDLADEIKPKEGVALTPPPASFFGALSLFVTGEDGDSLLASAVLTGHPFALALALHLSRDGDGPPTNANIPIQPHSPLQKERPPALPPLYYAIAQGDIELCMQLLKGGALVKDSQKGCSPLRLAIWRLEEFGETRPPQFWDMIAIVKLLIECGADDEYSANVAALLVEEQPEPALRQTAFVPTTSKNYFPGKERESERDLLITLKRAVEIDWTPKAEEPPPPPPPERRPVAPRPPEERAIAPSSSRKVGLGLALLAGAAAAGGFSWVHRVAITDLSQLGRRYVIRLWDSLR